MARREDYDIVLRATDQTQSAFASAKKGVEGLDGAVGILKAGLGAVGLSLALSDISARVKDAVSSLSAIGSSAKTVGVTTDAIQALRYEVEQGGGQILQADQALEKFADTASKAGTGGNYLAKVFAANHVSLKDQNGQLRSASDLLEDYAKLVANATSQQDKVRLSVEAFGKQAGPQMVDVLERIAHVGLQGVINQGKAAGVIIDKNLIDKAEEIDKKWKTNSAKIETYIKGSIIKALEAIQDYPEPGTPLAEFLAMVRGSEKWKIDFDIEIEPGSPADHILNWIKNKAIGPKTWGQMFGETTFNDRFQSMKPPSMDSSFGEGMGAYSRVVSAAQKAGEGWANTIESTGKTKLPMLNDAVDKAVQSIGKHIATMEADARTVGATAGAQEALRVRTQLLEVAHNAGIPVAGEYAKKIDDIAARAKGAADALAAAKLNSDIFFERDQLGRSTDEQQIASKLRSSQIDPSSAIGQAAAQEIRLNQALSQTKELSADALKGFISDLRAGKDAGEAFANVLDKIASKMIDKGIDSLLSGGFSLFGGGSGGGVLPGGLPLGQGGIGHAARGGSFNAGDWSVVGEEGPELVRFGNAARVFPNDVSQGMGGNIHMGNIIIQGNVGNAELQEIKRAQQEQTRQFTRTRSSMNSSGHEQKTGVMRAS
jgi:hypothetical protein